MRFIRTPLALAATLASLQAGAFQIAAPEDWSIVWDNTVKLSTKVRTAKADPKLNDSYAPGAGGPICPNCQALNFNAGDQNFQRRGIVSERLDLLSEFDVTWRQNFGLRVSAAGWYDQKLHEKTKATGTDLGYTPIDEFAPQTRRMSGGKAELLDAFVFGGWRVGETSKLTARLGRHALQYGESLFFGDNGIARAQGPIDIDKLLAAPGAQFKEIIRPVPQVSAMLQLSAGVAIGGYYQFRWEEDRLPPAGSYFSTGNPVWGSPAYVEYFGPYTLGAGPDQKPKDSGQFGLQLKWRVNEVDLGFYFARYHDKDGQLYALLGIPPNGQWLYKFPEGIRTFGASATYSIGDVNLAAEASIRDNMPLRNTQMVWIAGTPQTQLAKGKTAHLNVSALATFGPSFLSQESTFLGELAWNRVLKIDDPQGQLDAGRTRDATAARVVFSPTYRQVMPGLDISVPLGLGYVLAGNSAITSWNARHNGDASIGIEGNYNSVWQFSATYTKYLGPSIPFSDYAKNSTYGLGNSLGDRDFIALSLRRAF